VKEEQSNVLLSWPTLKQSRTIIRKMTEQERWEKWSLIASDDRVCITERTVRKTVTDQARSEAYDSSERQSTKTRLSATRFNTKNKKGFSDREIIEVVCVLRVWAMERKTDNRKRGSQKMLDTKIEQKWPLIAAYQNCNRGSFLFYIFYCFFLSTVIQ